MSARTMEGADLSAVLEETGVFRPAWELGGSVRFTGPSGEVETLAGGDAIFLQACVTVSAVAGGDATVCVCAVRAAQ